MPDLLSEFRDLSLEMSFVLKSEFRLGNLSRMTKLCD